MADLLDRVRGEIHARLDELRPLAQEAADLERAVEALGGSQGPARVNGPATRSRARSAASRPRRAARGETRDRIIAHIASNPGATAGDVAGALSLNRNSVATRLAQLAKAGALVKAERGYRAP
jgi:cell division septum initiation protein DivIVA